MWLQASEVRSLHEDDRGVLDARDGLHQDGGGDVLRKIAIAPRRATVSAMRRPEMAVMFATISGSGSARPSVLVRSTSRRDRIDERVGDMKTSS